MPTASLRPLPEDRFGYWEACHLLNRAGFGATPSEIRRVADLGLEGAVRSLTRPEAITDPEPVEADRFDSNIMRPLSEAERRAYRDARQNQDEATVDRFRQRRQAQQREDRAQARELQRWWLSRMVSTSRPLVEKMTLFWHGHFATSYRGTENSYHLFVQNQTFRKYALGSFEALCHQIIRDPAMLAYLNNDNSRRRAPNENFARELMELFTLGEGNGYGERDIKEGARALTGYTFDHNQFIFRGQWHDSGTKRILGRSGAFDGDDFVDLILAQSACSQFIAYKMYRFFVNDLPNGPDRDTQQYILGLASQFRRSDYSLTDLIETMLMSAHFYDPANVRSQIKSPVNLAVGAYRTFGLPATNMDPVIEATSLMGQQVFVPPSVKGWEGGRSWINTSTLFVRQNLLVHLLTGAMPGNVPSRNPRGRVDPERNPMLARAMRRRGMAVGDGASPAGGDGVKFDAMALLDDLHQTHAEVTAEEAALYLLRLCLGNGVHESRQASVLNYVRERDLQRLEDDHIVDLLCLITAMPEYQLC
ncbi:MAG: DUF1800 domain-containing protein [Planctomycetota bacterium]